MALLPIVLGMGFACGAANGVLIAYLRLPPIIVTLGTYLFYAGLSGEILPDPGGDVLSWLITLNGDIGPIPGVLFVLAATVTGGVILLSRTAYVRNLLAVGGDICTAYTAGIDVNRTRVLTYALCGMLAAPSTATKLLQGGHATSGNVCWPTR